MKASIAILVLSVLAVLIAGCASQVPPDSTLSLKENSFDSVVTEELGAGEAIPGPAITTPLALQITGVELRGFGGSVDESKITGSGEVYAIYDDGSDEPLANVEIEPFCGAGPMDLVGKIKTDENGKFDFTISNVYEVCNEGDYVWFTFEYDGKAYKSAELGPVPDKPESSGGRMAFSPPINTFAGVPEFSTLTLGAAIIGVGLGLAFLRKHN